MSREEWRAIEKALDEVLSSDEDGPPSDVWQPNNVTNSRSVPDRHDATEPKDNS